MSGCHHAPGFHGSQPVRNDQDDKRITRASAVPFGIAPVDETARRERIERLKRLLE